MAPFPGDMKDRPSANGVRSRKIRDSESTIVGRQHFSVGGVCEENFPLLSETYKNCGGGDEWCCYLSSSERPRTPIIVKRASLLMSNVPICLNFLNSTPKFQLPTSNSILSFNSKNESFTFCEILDGNMMQVSDVGGITVHYDNVSIFLKIY